MKTAFFAVLSTLALGVLAAPASEARAACTYTCPQGLRTTSNANGQLSCSSYPGVGIHGGIYTCEYSTTNGAINSGVQENANCPLTAASSC